MLLWLGAQLFVFFVHLRSILKLWFTTKKNNGCLTMHARSLTCRWQWETIISLKLEF